MTTPSQRSPPWPLLALANGVEGTPQIDPAAMFKMHIDGLPANLANTVQVASSQVPGDGYLDTPSASSDDFESPDWAVVYEGDETQMLTPQEKALIKAELGLNVLHNDDRPNSTLTTKAATATRPATPIDSLLSTGPRPVSPPPAPILDLVQHLHRVTLRCTASKGATSYRIGQLASNGRSWAVVDTVAPDKASYRFDANTLRLGTVYSWRVVAVKYYNYGQTPVESSTHSAAVRALIMLPPDRARLFLRQEAFDSLVGQEAAHKRYLYYHGANVDYLFDQLFSALNFVRRVELLQGTSEGRYLGRIRTLELRAQPRALNVAHELTHAVDHMNNWYTGDVTTLDMQNAEALAYSVEYLLEQARLQNVGLSSTSADVPPRSAADC